MFKTTQAKLMLITEACVSRGQAYEEWHLGAKIFLTTQPCAYKMDLASLCERLVHQQ